MSDARKPSAPREVTIVRTFLAPRALVYRMWTQAEHMQRWWGPRGFGAPQCEIDARPGGRIRMLMTGMGSENPLEGEFIAVDPPSRIEFNLRGFGDGKGGWMIEHHNVVTFEEIDGVTRMTLQGHVLHADPALEAALAGMSAGWNESLDKMAEAVTRESAGLL